MTAKVIGLAVGLLILTACASTAPLSEREQFVEDYHWVWDNLEYLEFVEQDGYFIFRGYSRVPVEVEDAI